MKKFKARILPFAGMALLISTFGFSYSLSDVLSHMENAEKAMSSLHVIYEQEIRFTAMDSVSIVQGEADFAKGGRFRIHKRKPDEQIIVSDGKSLSVYTPAFKQMWKGAWKGWEKAAMVPKGMIPMNNFTDDLRKSFNVTLAGKSPDADTVRLSAVPEDKDAGYRLELGISSKTWLVTDLKFVSETAEIKTTFSKIQTNEPVSPGIFSMKAPAGVDVIPLN